LRTEQDGAQVAAVTGIALLAAPLVIAKAVVGDDGQGDGSATGAGTRTHSDAALERRRRHRPPGSKLP
jgi:hypothetical protein